MTFTAQITPYTCALACLESFYTDHDRPITQETLLRDYPEKCFVGRIHDGRDISGALSLNELCDLCIELKLQPFQFHDFRPELSIPAIRGIAPTQAVLFFISHVGGGEGPTHTVRYSRMKDETTFEVMDPSGGPDLWPISWQQFVDWDTHCIVINLPQEIAKILENAHPAEA